MLLLLLLLTKKRQREIETDEREHRKKKKNEILSSRERQMDLNTMSHVSLFDLHNDMDKSDDDDGFGEVDLS